MYYNIINYMESIESEGYILVKNALSKEILELLKLQITIHEKTKCYEKNIDRHKYFFKDSSCEKSFSEYGILCSEALLLQMKPFIDTYCNLDLIPTYSYSRIYYNGSILDRHIDRPSCEYSMTCCISCDGEPWDFYIKNKKNEEKCIKMEEGDIVIYKGCEVEHWRKIYNGNRQIQIFLHYVNSTGIYKEYKFDKRPFIGINTNNK